MNYGIVLRVLGILLIIESSLMAPSLLISLYEGEHDFYPFLITIIITLIVGIILSRKKGKDNLISAKDGLAIVALGWLSISILGAMPLFLAKSTPTYIDAFFEIVSGFTTTGSSVIENVEILPKGILFWRSFTHWIGGMGILVFTIALLPALGVGGFQIYKAESPGPIAGKMAPRIKDTAKILYITYFSITILQVILLLFGKMSLFDALLHTFGTVGTGGFGIKAESVGYYKSSYIHIVIAVFMVLSGVSFSLYYSLYRKKIRDVIKNEELGLYLGIVISSTLFIAINLYMTNYGKISLSLRDSFFQVASIMTTTGYSTADFDLWPSFSKGILVLLMFIGASAGSTAGGIKVIRILVMFKLIKREILKIFHPRAIIPIRNDGRVLSNEVIAGIYSFIALYMVIFSLSTLLVTLEGVDLVTASTSVIATLSNIGPGLALVGPTRSFALYSGATKMLLSFLMLLGRLELFTIIALLAPKNWRREM
ncbi:TrkH family potassium uptake protein [Tissierella creatinophila]|uniref:Trk system potassium uptake protein TrkG n=1 Tax=Tissierella creatinophila DSM 6911 TaxID=1123403 RepID=A0A1U7M2L7_TISCR|nr:TrkH family potassium uptake protein [Tissierella creatinophila]OLS01525.1 Trk system potassium uptake protein TrkG [Tissierella creatinophila DSM 6911]